MIIPQLLLFLLATFGYFPLNNSPTNIATRWNTPENISILNSPEDDFAPIWNKFENLLYYNSTKDGSSKFYITTPNPNTIFNAPELLKSELNQARNNQSYITFLSNTKAFLSTYKMSEFRPYINIFQSNKQKNKWSKPFPVDSLSGSFFIAHPTVSPDETFIIFTTNKNNPKNTDLWIAYLLENGTYGNIHPLTEINTEGNEITPFLLSPDTLFFASDGFGGLGGFDIFYSIKINNAWQSPLPVHSLNSEYNESDLSILPNGDAIFASDRPGGKGKLDLYYASVKQQDPVTQQRSASLELSLATQVISINLEIFKYKIKASSNPNNAISTKIEHFYTETNFENLNWFDAELDSITIIPRVINAFVNCRPIGHLKKWEALIKFEGNEYLLKSANTLPDTLNIALDKFKNQIKNNDYLYVTANAYNLDNEKFTTNFEIPINKTIHTFQKFEFNNNFYEIYIIEFLNEIETIEQNIMLKKFIAEQQSAPTKITSIIINDLSASPNSTSTYTEKLALFLSKSFNLQKTQIKKGINIPFLQNWTNATNKNIRTLAILVQKDT